MQRHNVEFIVIGGQAEYLMGSPRMTFDVDITYRRTPENLERLAQALSEIGVKLRGAPDDLPFRLDAKSLALGANFTFKTPFGAFDLLGYVEPIGSFEDVEKNAEIHRHGAFEIRAIGLEDLIKVKRHIRRTKDDASLVQLLAIREHRARIKPNQ